MKNQTISKDDFLAYEKVRKSGITNMFNVSVVCSYSKLTREQVLFIMKHYTELKKELLK